MSKNSETSATILAIDLTDTERVVGEVWREVLQMPSLPAPSDGFFALGGDSMTMAMAEYRIREELSVDLPADAIMNTRSLRELSLVIEASASTL
jgi:acyl carrier protein